MGYIYEIFNDINKNKYIGKTVTTIKNRWQHHLSDYLIYDWHLYRAMRKYGVEHFFIKEIEECEDGLLDERERYWIKKFDSFRNGYNMTIGGDGRKSLDRKKILKDWENGKSVKEISESLGCWSSSIVQVLKELNLYDIEEVQRRKSLYIAKKNTKKKIIQYNEAGEFIESFDCIREIELKTGINGTAIRTALAKQIGAGGFLWRREDEPEPTPKKVKICKRRKVEQIDLETGEVINTFDTISAAARALNIDSSCISKVCKGKRNKTGGYKWRYVEEE